MTRPDPARPDRMEDLQRLLAQARPEQLRRLLADIRAAEPLSENDEAPLRRRAS